MTDIVERLRTDDVVWGVRPSLAFEAADEIEKLREQLKYSNDFREIMNEERCDALEENERLREALKQAQCNCEEPCLHGRWCSSWIARAALKERE